jgi:hypothetical protein
VDSAAHPVATTLWLQFWAAADYILIRPALAIAEPSIEVNPDSAVGTDRKREAQSFRSEADRFLPLRIHRPALR